MAATLTQKTAVRRSACVMRVEHILVGLLISIAVLLFVAQGYCVTGDCMEPHLYTGERVLVNKLSYTLAGPRRGDIIVFQYPRDPRQAYVKRVIALPGETVAIKSGQVWVDQRPLPEPYKVNPAHGDTPPRYVPHDQYFVMGDNRDVSDDSRYWGDLPRSRIVGRAVACYWPPQHCQVLH